MVKYVIVIYRIHEKNSWKDPEEDRGSGSPLGKVTGVSLDILVRTPTEKLLHSSGPIASRGGPYDPL